MQVITEIKFATSTHGRINGNGVQLWRDGLAVTSLGVATRLLYVEPGYSAEMGDRSRVYRLGI